MLLRTVGDAVVAITQPAHAFVSGQLARAWGNNAFGRAEPWEETCLGAEQHDAGMAAWEQRPTLNRATGLPHTFMELDLDTHLAMWSSAAPLVATQSRYAAALVSGHGSALYERRDLDGMPSGDAARVRGFLADQAALREELLAPLRADPAEVERNRRLVWTWDSLSLGLLLDWWPYELRDVPTAAGRMDVAMRGGPDGTVTLDPWPFAADAVVVGCDGRRLSGRFDDEAEMRAALAAAPSTTVEIELRRSQVS